MTEDFKFDPPVIGYDDSKYVLTRTYHEGTLRLEVITEKPLPHEFFTELQILLNKHIK